MDDVLGEIYSRFEGMTIKAAENYQSGMEVETDGEIREKRKYTANINDLVARYTPKQYNDYGWVAVNKVLTGKNSRNYIANLPE